LNKKHFFSVKFVPTVTQMAPVATMSERGVNKACGPENKERGPLIAFTQEQLDPAQVCL